MSRVLALVPDLLFASKVQAMLAGEGHEVRIASAPPDPEQLDHTDVLVVDLADRGLDGVEVVRALRVGERAPRVRVLGFFAHVEPEVRERALQAGFDLVVPRSRMAREGAALVARLGDG